MQNEGFNDWLFEPHFCYVLLKKFNWWFFWTKLIVEQNKLSNKVTCRTKWLVEQSDLLNKVTCWTKWLVEQSDLSNKTNCRTNRIVKQNDLSNKMTCQTKRFVEQNGQQKLRARKKRKILRQTNDTISLHDTLSVFVSIWTKWKFLLQNSYNLLLKVSFFKIRTLFKWDLNVPIMGHPLMTPRILKKNWPHLE